MRACCKVVEYYENGEKVRPSMHKGPDNGWAWMLGSEYMRKYPNFFRISADGFEISRYLQYIDEDAFIHVMKFATDNGLQFKIDGEECCHCVGHKDCIAVRKGGKEIG